MADDKNLKDIALEQDIVSVCNHAEGRRVLWEIMGFCNMYSEAGADPNQSIYLGGQRSVGLRILDMLDTVDPGIFIKMQKEHLQ